MDDVSKLDDVQCEDECMDDVIRMTYLAELYLAPPPVVVLAPRNRLEHIANVFACDSGTLLQYLFRDVCGPFPGTTYHCSNGRTPLPLKEGTTPVEPRPWEPR